MKYLCLIYEDESLFARASQADIERTMQEYFAFTNGIQQSGNYIDGQALHPTNTAVTVRVRNGRVSTTDGPFAETKEQLGGYYAIEARDLNEAIQIAARIPGAASGCVEVRPIVDFSQAGPPA